MHPTLYRERCFPKKAAVSKETHAATLDEVTAILDAIKTTKVKDQEITPAHRLKLPAAVALMFFAGLRPGEARGVSWEDFDRKHLMIRKSVWHAHTTAPKTEESEKAVPIIEPLTSILAELRADVNPATGPILRGPSGKPMNLDNASKRILQPLLKAAKLPWHGWYSLRRGIATTLTTISKDQGMASKGLLRHSSLATTQKHYVKDVPENTQEAMNKLQQLFNDCSTTRH